MLCQHCNKNQANIRFQYNVNGQAGEMQLCSECAEKLQAQSGLLPQISSAFGPMFSIGNMGGMMDWNSASSLMGHRSSGLPAPEIDADLKRRKRINELRAQQDSAVSREDYEEAARLRDEIEKTEKGVCTHES